MVRAVRTTLPPTASPRSSGPVTTSGPVPPSEPAELLDTLAAARRAGFLGPGALEPHIRHALGFADALGVLTEAAPAKALDLGSGGGLPGLVLAARWPEVELLLLEAGERRAAFLVDAVASLGFGDRVRVLRERAEVAGHRAGLRGGFDVVVARSFGAPAVTAECAAPFLRVGGALVTSGPPDVARHAERWPAEGLSRLGLGRARQWTAGFTYELAVQLERCPERFPRRIGVPAKRLLF